MVAPRVFTYMLEYLLAHLILFVIGSLAVTDFVKDFASSLGKVASLLGNVGLELGSVGPKNNFIMIPTSVKWIV